MELILSNDCLNDNEYTVSALNIHDEMMFIMDVTRTEYIVEINRLFIYGPKNEKSESLDLNEIAKLTIDPKSCTLGLDDLKSSAELIIS